MDTQKIYEALGNEMNEKIMNTSFEKIEYEKNDILQKLPLTEEKHVELMNSLIDYKFCDDTDELHVMSNISWIPLQDVNDFNTINLKYGKIIKMYETNENVNIVYFIGKRIFTLKFSENLIFKKLTEEEDLILKVIEQI